jgi:hypothetical protein
VRHGRVLLSRRSLLDGIELVGIVVLLYLPVEIKSSHRYLTAVYARMRRISLLKPEQ